MFKDSKFILSEAIYPIWEGDTVLRESFLPLRPKGAAEGRLMIPTLYPIRRVISLRNARLDVQYEEGRDFTVVDGMLMITERSRIFVMEWDDYNPQEPPQNWAFTCKLGGYLNFAEGAQFHNRQSVITYEHDETWDGPEIKPAPGLPKTRARIAAKQPIRLGVLGDSIAAGSNASAVVDAPPYTPMWVDMVAKGLAARTGCEVKLSNKSVGGTASKWGLEVAEKEFKDNPPDLFIVAFGMNDASGDVPTKEFAANIRGIINAISKLNPDCEFLVVSTTLPNHLANQFYKLQADQQPALAEIVDELGDRAALVPMTDIHEYLLLRKRYYDMTGNNINHPNDFLIRVYASVILAIIG